VADLWDLVATREGLASWLMENDFEPVTELTHSGFSGLRGREFQQIPGLGWRGLLRTDIRRRPAPRK
jgi:hypothetical protein